MMKHTRQVLSTIAAALALMLWAQAANAQRVCAVRDQAVVQLEKQFDEQVAGRGLAADSKAVIEIFVSETGSWTVLASDVNGRSCIVASGEYWQQVPVVDGGPA